MAISNQILRGPTFRQGKWYVKGEKGYNLWFWFMSLMMDEDHAERTRGKMYCLPKEKIKNIG